MADGENGTKAEHAEPGAPTDLEHKPVETPREVTRPENVWTASDARGPLVEAGTVESPIHDPEAHQPGPHDPEAAHHEPSHDPVSSEPVVEPMPAAAAAVDPAHDDIAAPKPKSGVLPIAAGIVAGAIIGAASALALYSYLAPSGAGADTGKQIAALSSRVDALQAHPPADANVAPLKTSVADLGDKVAALQRNIAALQAATKTAASAPQASPPQAPAAPAFDPAPLQKKVDALQTGLDNLRQQTNGVPALDGKVVAIGAALAALQTQTTGLQTQTATLQTQTATLQTQTAPLKDLEGQVADLKTGLGDAQKQAGTAQTDITKLQAGQKTLEGKVTSSPALAVVADSLVEQIDHGAPYAGQVAALTSLGADPAKVAVLKENADKGVPSAKALAASFEPLADPMVASEHHVAPNAGFMDRMKSGMASMISIRPVGDTSGDDLGSRVARIQADLTHDDVAAAFATWNALPQSAKAKSEAWGALAKTHAEAMAAAHALQVQAITALGAKK